MGLTANPIALHPEQSDPMDKPVRANLLRFSSCSAEAER